jgi:hypothetical protein
MGERHRSQYKSVDKTQSIVKTIAASKAVQRQMTMYVRGSVYWPHSQSGKPTAHMFTLDLPTELSRHELSSPFQGLIEHVDTCYQAQTIARGSLQQVALSVVSGVLRRCTVPCCLYCQLIPSDEGQKWSSGLLCESGCVSHYMLEYERMERGHEKNWSLFIPTITRHPNRSAVSQKTHTGQHAPYATGPNMQNKHNQHNTIIQT